jgi:hypothetical protein
MANFDKAYQRTAMLEGGLNPDDKGSVTLFGIRRKNNPNWDGWKTYDSLVSQGLNSTEIQKKVVSDKKLKSSAKEYTRANYWNPMGLNSISDDEVAYEIFDHGFNAGTQTSSMVISKSFGINGKKSLDNETIFKINSLGKDALNVVRGAREKHYLSIDDNKNKPGWLKRIGFGSTEQEDLQYKKKVEAQTEGIYEGNRGRRDAGIIDKTVAFGLNASINSTTNDIVEYFSKTNILGDKDSNWMKQMEDSSSVDSLLSQYDLDTSYFQDIKKSESRSHFTQIVNSIKEREWQDQFVSMRLGTAGLVASGLVGGLAMSPENLLLPVMIPMRAARAIVASEEALALAEASYTGLRTTRQLKPTANVSQKLEGFSTSAVAAQELAFANKAAGIRKAAMLQGASLAVVTPNIKYAVNKDYTQSDYLFDLLTYGAIDLGFINHATKSGTADVLTSSTNILNRIQDHYSSLAKSSNEYSKAMDKIRSEDIVAKSADKIRKKKEDLKANIDAETERLKTERLKKELAELEAKRQSEEFVKNDARRISEKTKQQRQQATL